MDVALVGSGAFVVGLVLGLVLQRRRVRVSVDVNGHDHTDV